MDPEAMMHDPGNDLEAAVNVQVGNPVTGAPASNTRHQSSLQALSNEHLEKLSDTSTLQSFDEVP